MATLNHPRRGYKITVPDSTVGAYAEQGFVPAGTSKEWPTGDSLNADIVAFAEREGINLGSARTKWDMLDAIADARTLAGQVP